MFSVTREITFCYGHRLLDYEGKCRHLHGHNGKAVITLSCRRPRSTRHGRGFHAGSSASSAAGSTSNSITRCCLHRDDPVLPFLASARRAGFRLDVNPTAENIARLIFDFTVEQGFPVVEVKLWETESCFAAYSPS